MPIERRVKERRKRAVSGVLKCHGVGLAASERGQEMMASRKSVYVDAIYVHTDKRERHRQTGIGGEPPCVMHVMMQGHCMGTAEGSAARTFYSPARRLSVFLNCSNSCLSESRSTCSNRCNCQSVTQKSTRAAAEQKHIALGTELV